MVSTSLTYSDDTKGFEGNIGADFLMSFYMFLVWVFILMGRPQDFFPFLIPFRLALVFAFITLAAMLLSNKKISIADLFQISGCKKYTFFYLIMILGIPFAYHRGVAFNYVFQVYLNNMLFFFIFLYHVDSFEKLKATVFVICLCALLYSVLSLISGAFAQGRFGYGTMYDPNDLAYLLVSLFPLCIYFTTNNKAFFKKIIAIVTIALSILTVLYTGSRGGFLGLVAVFPFILFMKIGGIKRSYKLTFIIGLAILCILYGSKIDTERYMTITEIGDDYNVSDEFGRFQIWKRALGFILSNPVTGVGVNCFSMAIGYGREAEGEIPKWQVAHNSYMQVAAEIGLVGFFIFILLIINSLKSFVHFTKINTTNNELLQLNSLSQVILLGFIGHLVCAFFLTQAYSILFTLFFALSAVVKKLYSNFETSNQTLIS